MTFKTCTACRKTYSISAWAALPTKGTKIDAEDPGVVHVLVLKDCPIPCGGTMAIETSMTDIQYAALARSPDTEALGERYRSEAAAALLREVSNP